MDSLDYTVETPLAERMARPFQRFAREEASGGIVLLACALIAIVLANSPLRDLYFGFWHTNLRFELGGFVIDKDLRHWINDGLMAVFFFVVGLEIKREFLVGELSSPKAAALPVFAAAGGMLAPALVYVAINAGEPGIRGWGIPMATDIAFALGVMALLGKRVPLSLKVFLTALAIVDDIGAVLVIAFFYTAHISPLALGVGGAFLLGLIGANRAGVREPLVYLVLSVGLWVCFLKSGVHATVAGVLSAMTIPATMRINPKEFLHKSRDILHEFEHAGDWGETPLTNTKRQAAIEYLEVICERAETPMQRLERAHHPYVVFLIMPVFALANAGVALGGELEAALLNPVTLGVMLGLLVGKQAGVTLFSWIAIRSGLASMPKGVGWRHIYGASLLAGIGFTMSLFIAGLGFGESGLFSMSQIGIFVGSLLSAVLGWHVLNRASRGGEQGG